MKISLDEKKPEPVVYDAEREAIKKSFKGEKKKLSKMRLSEKLKYIWSYYRIPIIGGIFAIVALSYLIFVFATKKETVFMGVVVNDPTVRAHEYSVFLDDYLSLIREIPQPAQGEADALRLSAMAGDEQAQKRLAEVMLIRVVDIARLYAGQDVLIEDLIGAGNEALARGVKLLAPLETPDEVDGALGRRIMDAMEDLISQRIDERAADRDVEDLVNRVAKEAGELAQDLGRKVTVAELAREGVVSEEEILRAIRFSGGKIEELEAP